MQEKIVTLLIKCIKCDKEKQIEQKFSYKTKVCRECRNEQQRELQKRYRNTKGYEHKSGRRMYPLEGKWTHINSKFRELQKELDKINDKKEWRKVISDRLDAVLNNAELYDWIISHKSNKPVSKNLKNYEEFEEDI